MDINLIVNHIGRKTNCVIEADGSLNDRAEKIFRGTIDFKNGSSGSKGQESEQVLLLGDDVVNKTIPLILCAEENVEGNHGATSARWTTTRCFILPPAAWMKRRPSAS